MSSTQKQALKSPLPAAAEVVDPPAQQPVWRGLMGQVAELCGADVARSLMEKLSGAEFYVPKKYRDNGPLSELSRPHALALIAEFKGEIIYVPSAMDRSADKYRRFLEIEALVQQGVASAKIANQLSMSQRYMFRLRKEFGATPIRELRKRPDTAFGGC